MRSATLLAALLSAALALPVAAAEASDAPAGSAPRSTERAAEVKPRSDSWEAKVLKLTNKRRAAHGVKPLKTVTSPDHFA